MLHTAVLSCFIYSIYPIQSLVQFRVLLSFEDTFKVSVGLVLKSQMALTLATALPTGSLLFYPTLLASKFESEISHEMWHEYEMSTKRLMRFLIISHTKWYILWLACPSNYQNHWYVVETASQWSETKHQNISQVSTLTFSRLSISLCGINTYC